MNIKPLFSLLTLLAASSAFAGPAYQCTPGTPSNTDLAPLNIYVQSESQIAYATVVDGQEVPKTVLNVDKSLPNVPDGFTGYFAIGGCSQTGPGLHCFAIFENRLLISNGMLSGAEYGQANLNSQDYDCQLQ